MMALATVLVCGGCTVDSSGDRDSGTTDTDTDGDTDTDSDSDTDTDTDTDTDSDCTSGVCCDTSTSTYRPSTYACGVTTAFSCTSSDCGADAQEQDTTQYCSGSSELCNGSTVPGGWTVVDDCATDAICEYDTTDSWCTGCTYGCTTGSCIVPECSSGVCCETVAGTFHPSTYACDVTTAYSCTSTNCGADAQEQDTTQYCSGSSEICDGSTVPGGLITVDDCATDAICESNTTNAWCTNCPYGCTTGSCIVPECSSGVCCETVAGTFHPSTYACDVTTAYSCTSSDCGADAQEQDTTQYCSGSSEICDGSTVPGGLITVDDCATDAICEYDTTDSWCTDCPGGCTMGACDPVCTSIPNWTEHIVDGAFGVANSVYAADVDGDGDMDVLGAAGSDCDITWWENTAGDGSTWTEHTVDGNFDWANSVYAADVDGDGDMDVLGAASDDYEIAWWENTAGDGTAWTKHTVDGAFTGAWSVYAADVDGDGDMDVLGAAVLADAITWWENTAGDGTAWTEHTVDGAFDGAVSVYAADVDGDGDMDVLGAAANDDHITWWENTTGNGTAWTEHTVDGAFNGARSVYAADVDGDGDMDVLGAASNDNDNTWWENTTGDGTAWTEHTVDGAFDGAHSVYAADVDGDGDMDVLGAAWVADDITWWENTAGDGTAWTEHTVDGSFLTASSVYAADIDGDGDMDVLGAAAHADDITWWESDCIP